MLLDLADLDPTPMTNAWTGIEQQLIQLSSKVDETWSDKVEPAFEEADWDWDEQIEPQARKGTELNDWLEREREVVGIRIFAEAAEQVFEKARSNLSRDFECNQCGSAVSVSDRFFRSLHVPCDHCDMVNTFDPGTKVRAVEHFCCHHLSRAKSQELWFAWLDADQAMRHARDEDLALMKSAERALRAHTEAYYRARIEIVPEYEPAFAKDVEGRMRSFYQELSRSDVWDGPSG